MGVTGYYKELFENNRRTKLNNLFCLVFLIKLSKIFKIVGSKVSDNLNENQEEIYSKVLRAGRRTYFFDVKRLSKWCVTITESKKFTNDDGLFYYKKHKIYVYKEDFENFSAFLNETMTLFWSKRS